MSGDVERSGSAMLLDRDEVEGVLSGAFYTPAPEPEPRPRRGLAHRQRW